MKSTMPEGIGLVGAVIVGISLALGSQAASPKPTAESEVVDPPGPAELTDEVSADPVTLGRRTMPRRSHS